MANTPLPDPPPGEFYSWTGGGARIASSKQELFTAGVMEADQSKLEQTHAVISRFLQNDRLGEMLADADVRFHISGAMDDAAIERGNREVRAMLTGKYQKEAEAVLGRVQRFVKSNPALAEVMQRGAGSRVDVIELLAEHIESAGYR